MPKDISINLLRKKEKTAGFHTFVQWLLSYGRIIIVIVQTIALTALIYRFFLDRELESFQQKIKNNQAILADRKEEENTYRLFNERLRFIETINDSGERVKNLFTDIVATASGYMVFKNLSLSNDSINIEASTTSITLLNTFVKELREDDRIDTVSIGQIKSNASSGIITATFALTIKKGILGQRIL